MKRREVESKTNIVHSEDKDDINQLYLQLESTFKSSTHTTSLENDGNKTAERKEKRVRAINEDGPPKYLMSKQ